MKTCNPAAMKLMARTTGRKTDPNVSLLSSVTFDPSTNLFTYSYVVDNRAGTAAVNEVNVLVDSQHTNFDLAPNAQSGPAGWRFDTSVSGASPPEDEFGTFWAWFNENGIAAGAISAPFSFVTARVQNTFLNNNFFLFSSAAASSPPNDGIVAFGHVLAPDFGVVSPPDFANQKKTSLKMPGSRSEYATSSGDEPPSDCDPSTGAETFPVILGVEVQTSATSQGVSRIGLSIRFDRPMDAARAENPANYRLLEPVASGDTFRFVAIGVRLTYDAPSHTVILLWQGRPQFALSGLLTINGTVPLGLTDSEDVLFLDGQHDGKPGTNATILILPNAAGAVLQ